MSIFFWSEIRRKEGWNIDSIAAKLPRAAEPLLSSADIGVILLSEVPLEETPDFTKHLHQFLDFSIPYLDAPNPLVHTHAKKFLLNLCYSLIQKSQSKHHLVFTEQEKQICKVLKNGTDFWRCFNLILVFKILCGSVCTQKKNIQNWANLWVCSSKYSSGKSPVYYWIGAINVRNNLLLAVILTFSAIQSLISHYESYIGGSSHDIHGLFRSLYILKSLLSLAQEAPTDETKELIGETVRKVIQCLQRHILSRTASTPTEENLQVSHEFITTLYFLVDTFKPQCILHRVQLFWCSYALLHTPHKNEFIAACSLLHLCLKKFQIHSNLDVFYRGIPTL